MVYNLFVKENNFVVIGDIKCDLCKEYIGIAGVFEENWNGNRSVCVFKCTNCYGKRIDKPKIKEQKSFVIINTKVAGLQPYFPKPPVIRNGSGLSVYDITSIDKLGGETVDNTKYANRSRSIEQLNYHEKVMEEIEFKDKRMTIDQGIAYLMGFVSE